MLNFDKIQRVADQPAGRSIHDVLTGASSDKESEDQRKLSVREKIQRRLDPEDKRSEAQKIMPIVQEITNQVDTALDILAGELTKAGSVIDEHAETINTLVDKVNRFTGLVESLLRQMNTDKVPAAAEGQQPADQAGAAYGPGGGVQKS